MLDEYIFGNITRKSPEAPKTPVLLVESKRCVLGGAANVAHNIVSLGGKAILLGCLGDDESGLTFRKLLNSAHIRNHSFMSVGRPTTVKTRLFDGERQVARIDTEKTKSLTRRELKLFSKMLQELPRAIDFIVVSDYAKGMISGETMQLVLRKFSGGQILADAKPIHKNLMRNLRVITPNLNEVSLMAGVKLRRHEDIKKTTMALARELGTSVLATMGREGMMLCDKEGFSIHRIPPPKVRAVDVTGAGDVAAAACALALASGAPLLEAAKLANRAAAISVTKLGTATVRLKEIL